MNSLRYPVLISALSFLAFVKYATPILCYDCNSLYDPRCGEQFDPFSLGIVNCSLRDPPEHLTEVEPSVCRAIKMQIYGKVRIVRSCGYITAATDDGQCHRSTSSDQMMTTYCACTSDLCNSAGRGQAGWFCVAVLGIVAVWQF